MVDPNALAQLLQTAGPLGTLVVLAGWWLLSTREKRNDNNGRKEARRDIREIKESISELRRHHTRHLEHHARSGALTGGDNGDG